MIKIAPSILSADFTKLGQDIDSICPAADWLHFDVMDGIFVPNISVGIPVLQSVRGYTDMFLDVHLMIDRPIRYVKQFTQAGADMVNVHIEADTEDNTITALKDIRAAGKKAGITLKPKTKYESALPYIELIDMILVMTVEPGFGGQSFMEDMLPKISRLRELINKANPKCFLEVDGGINPETARLAVSAGADVLVAGSDVFKAADRKLRINEIRGYQA